MALQTLTRWRLCPSLAALSHLIRHRHTLTANVSSPPPYSLSLYDQLQIDRPFHVYLLFIISPFASPSLDRYDRHPSKFQLDESASPEPSPAIDAIIITSAHPVSLAPDTVQKPIAWLGDGPQPLGSGSTTACSIGGGGAPHTENIQTTKLQASMAYARLSSMH